MSGFQLPGHIKVKTQFGGSTLETDTNHSDFRRSVCDIHNKMNGVIYENDMPDKIDELTFSLHGNYSGHRIPSRRFKSGYTINGTHVAVSDNTEEWRLKDIIRRYCNMRIDGVVETETPLLYFDKSPLFVNNFDKK